jgi:hypothetical protein
MAPTPAVDNVGALALKPPRVNIFAKPDATRDQRSSGPQARTVFDAAAACRPDEGIVARVGGPGSVRAPSDRKRARIGWLPRLVCLAVLVAVVAALAPKLGTSDTIDRPRSPAGPHDTKSRGVGRRDTRAPAAGVAARLSTGRRARPHRGARHQRKRRGRPTTPARLPVRVTAHSAPRRPAPRRLVPARRLPARVPRAAPPEFM